MTFKEMIFRNIYTISQFYLFVNTFVIFFYFIEIFMYYLFLLICFVFRIKCAKISEEILRKGIYTMRHLLSPLDFSVEETNELLDLAADIEKNPDKYTDICKGKKIATLFYEPSTRTRLSFETAMLNLGGNVIGFSDANSSSASKGESVADTIRLISCYADICAMRHPKEGAPLVASLHSTIPVINAGDGGHQHPTQTLADLMTIRSLKGRLDHITIGLCGV